MSIGTVRVLRRAVAPALAAAVFACAGCGQTGPLYLPPKHKQPAKTAHPAPQQTAKAPAAATR